MRWMKVALFTAGLGALCILVLVGKPGVAQDVVEAPEIRMSREDWLASVEASRRRIDQMRQQHKSFLPAERSAAEEAADLARRAMEDDSLQAGDIVTTPQGFFRFHGLPGSVHKPDDFVPLGMQR
jgi:hypothetical protein